jgi:uncharacterized protein YjbI with pentapeptide repeats
MKNLGDLIAAHERFVRREPGGARAQFRFSKLPGSDLQRRQLKEIEFAGCDLTGSHMGLSNFSFGSFYGSNLSQCDLRGSHLVRTDLRGVSLHGAKLCFANLDEADFRKAALLQADEASGFVQRPVKTGAESEDDTAVNFANCSLRGVKLSKARLQGAVFDGALLEGADLNGANLVDASFDGAILTGASLEQTMLSQGALDGALKDPSPDALEQARAWLAAIQANAAWFASRGQEGAQAVLDGADLRVIADALPKARLAGASLRSTCGVGVSFAGADLRFANFAGADLRGCSFRDCDLTKANFAGANLDALIGRGGKPFRPQFDGAQLAGADFSQAKIDPALASDLNGAAALAA